MSQSDVTSKSTSQPRHWRSLSDFERSPERDAERLREFPPGADTLELSGIERRKFLGIMGASTALAGLTTLGGCIRKPVEHILPYTNRPEDLIPGKPRYFRTAFNVGGAVLGLHVESQDGRPTKIEGNPDHPMSSGASSVWAQGSILAMYDPDRSQKPLQGGKAVTWDAAWAGVEASLAPMRGNGAGLAVLVDARPSPTHARLLGELKKAFPNAIVARHDVTDDANARAGAALVGAAGTRLVVDLAKADVIVALDSDFIGSEGDATRNARGFAERRRVRGPKDEMNRLYAVEPAFTVTGAMADNRLRLAGSQVGELLRAIAGKLLPADAPSSVRNEVTGRQTRDPAGLAYSAEFIKWADAVAADLLAHKGRSLVIVGERQPAWAHALAALVNSALGNVGQTVQFVKDPTALDLPGIADVAAALTAGTVHTLVTIGGNPAYDAPADLGFADLLGRARTVIHAGAAVDETGSRAGWHLPTSHYLEAWGDLRSADGTVTIQQPLIAPLYDTVSEIEVLGRIVGAAEKDGHALVRKTLLPDGALLESSWKRAVHDGKVGFADPPDATPPAFTWDGLAGALAKATGPAKPSSGALEVNFAIDPKVCDGRYANIGWLQELPDPLTKLTWDNAAYLGPKTADALGVNDGDMVQLTYAGRALDVAVWRSPGTADDVVVLNLGYGREKGGLVAQGAGFDTYKLRTSDAPWFGQGATLKKLGRTYDLASTQDYGSMTEPMTGHTRPIVREATLDEFHKDPDFVEKSEILHEAHLKHLWTPPNETGGQQWGMSIDLNVCTGCNACTIACQAENNIPVVGKSQVMNGREMHWIRLDRYYTGDQNDPQALVQPLPCQQCEMAPCESVCPVAATSHSPEGLNDMAYNRCIGTRYCANNCPYKVRRFNFFAYQKRNDEAAPLLAMQRNPDVSVRFRGVMEKCTYCVQRINEQKIAAKRDGNGIVPDGAIVTACEQTCPTSAIVFGDIANPQSRVSLLKKHSRDYTIMAELNAQPRTTYLAKLRNPNPALQPAKGA